MQNVNWDEVSRRVEAAMKNELRCKAGLGEQKRCNSEGRASMAGAADAIGEKGP